MKGVKVKRTNAVFQIIPKHKKIIKQRYLLGGLPVIPYTRMLFAALGLLLLCSCASWKDPDNEFSVFGGKRVNIAGPNQMLEGKIEHFTTVQLAELIDPSGKRFDDNLINRLYEGNLPTELLARDRRTLELEQKRLRKAEDNFDTAKAKLDVEKGKLKVQKAIRDAELEKVQGLDGVIENITINNNQLGELKTRSADWEKKVPVGGEAKEALGKMKEAPNAKKFLEIAEKAEPEIETEHKNLDDAATKAGDAAKKKPADTGLVDNAKKLKDIADGFKNFVQEFSEIISTAKPIKESQEKNKESSVKKKYDDANKQLENAKNAVLQAQQKVNSEQLAYNTANNKLVRTKGRQAEVEMAVKKIEQNLPTERLDSAQHTLDLVQKKLRDAEVDFETAKYKLDVENEKLKEQKAIRDAELEKVQGLDGVIKNITINNNQLGELKTRSADWEKKVPVGGKAKEALGKMKEAPNAKKFLEIAEKAEPEIETEHKNLDDAATKAGNAAKKKPADTGLADNAKKLKDIADGFKNFVQEFPEIISTAKPIKEFQEKNKESSVKKKYDDTNKQLENTKIAVSQAQQKVKTEQLVYNEAKLKRMRLNKQKNDAIMVVASAAERSQSKTKKLSKELSKGVSKELFERKMLERALLVANTYGNPERHRNRIQDRLIDSSEQACSFYTDWIQRLDSFKTFALGGLTTILGGASAIVTGTNAARVLGGSAGITSGLNAEFDRAFFKNVAVHVLVPGIKSARNTTLNDIRRRQMKSIDEYNVLAAIRDVLEYHNKCTLNAGLQEAAEDIKIVNDPGLLTATETMLKIQKLQAAVGGGPLPEQDLPTFAVIMATKVIEEESSRILLRITALGPDLQAKASGIKQIIEEALSKAKGAVEAENEKATDLITQLTQKNAEFAAANQDENHAQLLGEIQGLRLQAKAHSQKVLNIASNFKTLVSRQEAELNKLMVQDS